MTVGTDTYILPADAMAYLRKMTMDGTADYFAALTEEQQERFLADALIELESIPKPGQKFNIWQPLDFPRYACGTKYGYETPEEVGKAQALEAGALLMCEIAGRKREGKALASKRAEDLLPFIGAGLKY